MLYTLRNNNRNLAIKKKVFGKNNFAISVIGEFNPIDMPGFLAGYYANRLSDTPAGTIQGASSGNWYNIQNIPTTTKYLRRAAAWSAIGGNGQLNGLNCWRTGFISPTFTASLLDADSNDILTGLTNFTIAIVVYRTSASTFQSIFFTHMLTGTANQFYLAKRITGEFQIDMFRFSNTQGVNLITANAYNDNEIQIVIAQFDQTNKTARLIVNGQEDISGTNANYISQVLDTNNETPRIGNYTSSTTSYRFNGLIGDIFFFNTIITDSQINQIANYLKNRFNGTWINI